MSIADFSNFPTNFSIVGPKTTRPSELPSQNEEPDVADAPPKSKDPVQRIREVRKQQGISVRSVARRTGMEPRRVREEEDPRSDLRVSDLRRWQKALDVPLIDLLEDLDEPISRPVLERARLVRIMKTAQAIKEKSRDSATQRLVQMLSEQLQELMPELKDVGAWHSVGKRRSLDDIGRIGEDTVPDDFYRGEY